MKVWDNKILNTLVKNGCPSLRQSSYYFSAYVQMVEGNKMQIQYAIGDDPHNFAWVPRTAEAKHGKMVKICVMR